MILKLDPADLRDNPEIMENIRGAFAEAVCRPDFVAALLGEPSFREFFKEVITPEKIWLSYEQVQDFLSLPRTTFYEWKERNEQKLEISYAPGKREPRIKFSSVLAVMEQGAVSAAAPTLPGVVPPKQKKPAPVVVTTTSLRLPLDAIQRDVALSPGGKR